MLKLGEWPLHHTCLSLSVWRIHQSGVSGAQKPMNCSLTPANFIHSLVYSFTHHRPLQQKHLEGTEEGREDQSEKKKQINESYRVWSHLMMEACATNINVKNSWVVKQQRDKPRHPENSWIQSILNYSSNTKAHNSSRKWWEPAFRGKWEEFTVG